MKRHYSTLLIICTLFFSTGCSKTETTTSNPVTTTYTITGLWTGVIANATVSQFYSLSIKNDGKLTFEGYDGSVEQFGIGTWTLSGSTFTANLVTLYGYSSNAGVRQQITATFNSSTGTLTAGKYQNTTGASDSGTFTVTKVN